MSRRGLFFVLLLAAAGAEIEIRSGLESVADLSIESVSPVPTLIAAAAATQRDADEWSVTVTDVERATGTLRITVIDSEAPDQGSITMVFAESPLELRQWIVVDAQGLTTTVALSEMRSNVKLDPNLFFIEDPK